MSIDAGYGAWLQAEALFTSDSDATTLSRWGAKAIETEITSPLALKAHADAEADRQVTFLCGPIVRDIAYVKGQRRDLVGQLITLTGDSLGYQGAGALAFVIDAEESEVVDMTMLNVLKRLT